MLMRYPSGTYTINSLPSSIKNKPAQRQGGGKKKRVQHFRKFAGVKHARHNVTDNQEKLLCYHNKDLT